MMADLPLANPLLAPDAFFGKIRDFSVSIVCDSLAEMAGTPTPTLTRRV